MAPASPRPPLVAIALLSVTTLAWEVLLTRLWSLVLWHHYASMIISAAMLGLGASGTALALYKAPLAARFGAVTVVTAAALAGLMPLTFLAAQAVPFNPLELLWDARQPAWLLVIYLLMALPFFCGGLAVGVVYARFGSQAPRVYASDVLGAGVGALGVIGLLAFLPPARAVTGLSALALGAAGVAAAEVPLQRRWVRWGLLAAAGLTAALPGVRLRPSPYKDLSQALSVVGARVVAERSGPLGQLTVVENTRVPLREAPGMSLASTAEPPQQLALYVDGNGPSALTRFDGALAPLAYLDQLTSALPYHLLERPRVLVLGAGAGSDVLQALLHHSPAVDAVELDPNLLDLLRREFRDFSGGLYLRPDVRVHEGEARGFVDASRERFDLIQLALLDSFGTASAGLHGLGENYLYTVEALEAYLAHLAPGGLLAITRWLTLPPRDALKLFATALAALEHSGAATPATRLVLVRGWKTATLLVKNGDFTTAQLAAVRTFCRERSFDLEYAPGLALSEPNRFNQLAEPMFSEGARALLGPQRQAFLDGYPYFIVPATDDRPHFSRSFRWASAAELWALRSQGGLPLLDWSYPLLVATLLQAVVTSGLCILAPLARRRSRRSVPGAPALVYFATLGLAFMFMEIAFIQKFVLFLAHPLYAVAVGLSSFLVFAGAGSWLSGRWPPTLRVGVAAAGLGALALLYVALLPGLFRFLGPLPDAARIGVAVALVAPLAFCMGVPYPAGLQRLAETDEAGLPWALAVNGFAGVVGAVLASVLAIHLGFTAVILLAVVLYGLAALSLRRFA